MLFINKEVGGVRESFSFHFRPCRLQETFEIYIGEKNEHRFSLDLIESNNNKSLVKHLSLSLVFEHTRAGNAALNHAQRAWWEGAVTLAIPGVITTSVRHTGAIQNNFNKPSNSQK